MTPFGRGNFLLAQCKQSCPALVIANNLTVLEAFSSKRQTKAFAHFCQSPFSLSFFLNFYTHKFDENIQKNKITG